MSNGLQPAADLTFFQQLAERQIDHEFVNVEEWGRSIRVNRIDAADVIKATTIGDTLGTARALLANCLADEDGNKLFPDYDEALRLIGTWPAGIQVHLGNVALRVNGMIASSIELDDVTKKN